MKKLFQVLKEEMIVIPVLIIALMYLKNFFRVNFPESAQYDMPSEVETIVFAFIKLIIFTSLSWFGLRIVFPKIFRHFRDYIYLGFNDIKDNEKTRISFVLYVVLFIALILLSTSCKANSNEQLFRSAFTEHLHTQLNIREATGKNDGTQVELFLKHVGLSKGNPWCAAYCSYNLSLFRVPNPKSAWSPNFALSKDIIWSPKLLKQNKAKQAPQMGDCFTLYYPKLKRVGHVGFIVGESSNYFITIEGNTNDVGSREGDGVYKKKRDKNKIHAVTNYITPYINKNEKANINTIIKYSSNKLQTNKKYSTYKAYYSERYNHSNPKYSFKRYNDNLEWRYSTSEHSDNKGHYHLPKERNIQYVIINQWQSIESRLLERFYEYKTSNDRFYIDINTKAIFNRPIVHSSSNSKTYAQNSTSICHFRSNVSTHNYSNYHY